MPWPFESHWTRWRAQTPRAWHLTSGARLAVIVSCGIVAGFSSDLRPVLICASLLMASLAVSWLHRTSENPWAITGDVVVVALVVGATPSPAVTSFAAYLALTMTYAAWYRGPQIGGFLWALGWLEVLSIHLMSLPPGGVVQVPWWPWTIISALTVAVAGWRHERAHHQPPADEPAYANAHRLLSELHVVARHLSLGLDPQTLAQALVDELNQQVPHAEVSVLVRSPGGRFVPVVGEHPPATTDSVILDSWVSADLVRRSRARSTIVALPVLMGERVVAVVVLTDIQHPTQLNGDAVASCRNIITRAGPRLASALLFDDVRRLATVDERHRLAREIHDGIAQDLASVGYLLEDIARDADPKVAGRLQELRSHLGTMVSELRLSIFDLRAGVDESTTVGRTLSEYVQRVGAQSGLTTHLSIDESTTRLPIATEVEVLRIAQEAVTNIRRHANADHLWLEVRVDPPRAQINIRDDGCGLGTARPDSMGITGMKERAARIGATVSVRNREDGPGTLVELIVDPLGGNTRSHCATTAASAGPGYSGALKNPRTMADSPSESTADSLVAGGGVP